MSALNPSTINTKVHSGMPCHHLIVTCQTGFCVQPDAATPPVSPYISCCRSVHRSSLPRPPAALQEYMDKMNLTSKVFIPTFYSLHVQSQDYRCATLDDA
ncbi:Hypothetical predicted protein [Pelobates cultripes]|uniref:Uncharacterized protein n=1 Tax=Pelobates cultripes TaxID=61616 RepID=A0AAD1SSX2_PELCU|nr:Hypothetical predicted protein [Pelobates cultripes]